MTAELEDRVKFYSDAELSALSTQFELSGQLGRLDVVLAERERRAEERRAAFAASAEWFARRTERERELLSYRLKAHIAVVAIAVVVIAVCFALAFGFATVS